MKTEMLSPLSKGATINSMRDFISIGSIPENIFAVLQKKFAITDNTVSISGETHEYIKNKHIVFKGCEIKTVVNDILKNASIVKTDTRNGITAKDAVRIVCMNGNLDKPLMRFALDRFIYLVLKLSNKHKVNFVKSLHPQNYVKEEGETLWLQQKK